MTFNSFKMGSSGNVRNSNDKNWTWNEKYDIRQFLYVIVLTVLSFLWIVKWSWSVEWMRNVLHYLSTSMLLVGCWFLYVELLSYIYDSYIRMVNSNKHKIHKSFCFVCQHAQIQCFILIWTWYWITLILVTMWQSHQGITVTAQLIVTLWLNLTFTIMD